MSAEALAGVFAARGLTPDEFRVLAVLADSEHFGEVCLPLMTLARACERYSHNVLLTIEGLTVTHPWVSLRVNQVEKDRFIVGTIDWQKARKQ